MPALCAACGEPLGGRYRYEDRWVCWPCLPRHVRREPRKAKPEPDRYVELVDHVRERLETLTGSTVFGIGPGMLAAYCPACLEGTVRIRFVWNPRPGIVVGDSPFVPDPDYSDEYNREVERMFAMFDEPGGHCSRGCSEADIAEALK